MFILDRYVFSECLKAFGFFATVITLIVWLNRSILLLSEVSADSYSALVLLELALFILPFAFSLIMPFAALAATIYVTNRLSMEREIVAMMSTGLSPWRLARPVFLFGISVCVMLAFLTNFLVPKSNELLMQRNAQISGDIAIHFLREGEFTRLRDGLTLYVREISEEGELRDIFLYEERDPTRAVTITAARAVLRREQAGAIFLELVEGAIQYFNTKTGQVSLIRFDSMNYNLSELLANTMSGMVQGVESVTTIDLLSLDPQLMQRVSATPIAMLREANIRIAHPLLAIGASLIGFSALMIGGFSRFGLWRQMVAGMVAATLVYLVNVQGINAAAVTKFGWQAIYMGPMAAIVVSLGMLAFAHRSKRKAE